MSFYNDKIRTNFYENKNQTDINTFKYIKNTNNNSGTMNTTKMNSSSTINNNYQDSQNLFPNASNFNTFEFKDEINQLNINNELNKQNNPTNIDEIIKNEMSSALIDSFLNEHQIKSIPMFILYLSEIWKELSREINPSTDINLGINLYAFNKYYHLPGLIGQRLFNLFNKRKNGYLSPSEFISGMCIIFCEEINSLINFIFQFYDFDEDEYITFDDVHAVLCYMPIVNGFNDMIDIEEEIHSTIDDIFINKKEKIDFNTFYDLIIRKERYEFFIPLISFFYDNKPFNNEEIKFFYSEYYNKGKINAMEGSYRINKVINLKEFETKEEKKENRIFKHIYINNKYNNRYQSPENKNNLTEYNNTYILKLNKTFSKTKGKFEPFKKMNSNNNQNIKISGDNLYDNDLDNEKENYEKLILKSDAFDRMRKSLPLVTGNSNILNLKKLTDTNNKEKCEKYEKDKKYKYPSINLNQITKKKKKQESFISNFCNKLIKNSCMTFNEEIDNNYNDNDSISLQKSARIILDSNNMKNNEDISLQNNKDNLNKQHIICESYLYKITKSGKLKKLYFKLYNYDLYYYKSENSKFHKGMHNLSTYFLELKPIFDNNNNNNKVESSNPNIQYNQKYSQTKKLINGIYYYYFLLINIKNEIHYYYTPSLQTYKEWTNNLKILLKYKNIYQQYIFHQIIGKGKNCIVFNAYDLINKRQVAIKKIEKSSLTLEDLSLLQTEVDTLKVCQHPYVVKFYETIETYNEFNIILEYCELGNLFYYLSKSKFVLDEEQIATYVHDISKAVYSMHNLGIIHRDLKLSNIALTKKNNKTEIRILDFGLSKILGPNQFCNEGYGTPGYAAPEVINRYNYSFEADIWSIGVICYFLFMKKLPFDYVRDGNNEMDMVENTLLDEVKFDYNIMRKYSKNAEKFIRDLMNKNTFDRPNITEVLEHPWFQLFFRKEVKKRIINTYKEEFYSNPDIDELYTYDENIEKENSKDVRDNYLLYTNVNNK